MVVGVLLVDVNSRGSDVNGQVSDVNGVVSVAGRCKCSGK